jgi:hypothetical protein
MSACQLMQWLPAALIVCRHCNRAPNLNWQTYLHANLELLSWKTCCSLSWVWCCCSSRSHQLLPRLQRPPLTYTTQGVSTIKKQASLTVQPGEQLSGNRVIAQVVQLRDVCSTTQA